MAQESFARMEVGVINALGNFIADMFANAFKSTGIDSNGWSIANGQFWFWVTVMALVLASVAMLQMGPSIILSDWKRMRNVTLGLVAAVPSSVLGVVVMQKISTFTDDVTNSLIKSLQDQDMAGALSRMFGYGIGQASGQADAASFINTLVSQTTPAELGKLVIVLIIVLLMWIASVFLYLGMALRGFGLVALAATAPIAFMMIGQPKLAAWIPRWVNMALGLLLAKPLAAAVLVLAVQVCSNGTSIALILVAIGAVFAAGFSPLWAVKLVSFAGSETANALRQRPSITQNFHRFSMGRGALKAFKR